MDQHLNAYGDVARPTEAGHGMDIASQRADELDLLAIEQVRTLVSRGDAKGAVLALDIGCGHGGQAARMAQAGAQVLAIDVEDCADKVAASMRAQGVARAAWAFRRIGIEQIGSVDLQADVIVCQRMIHYLRHGDALAALTALRRAAAASAALYLSASGMDSELADGYAGRGVDVRERFATLSVDRACKHQIALPVCLYREEELADLARAAGWRVRRVFRSSFGNVKLVATRG